MKFTELQLDENVLKGLDSMNFREMTPIQELTIPIILEGKDIIGCAQTGTGKTAAYTLPILNRLVQEEHSKDTIKAIIMVPTHELAQQIDMQFEGFSYFLPISTVVVYGGGDGADWEQQKRGLKMGADVVIATPGRLLSHIAHSNIDLSKVSYFILDEADRMLDMGFFDDIMQIVKKIPEKRQTIVFSATFPPKIRQLSKQILHHPEEINIAVSTPNESIDQSAYVCYKTQKMDIIKDLFKKQAKEQKIIVFSSSKQLVKELAFLLKKMKFNAAAMHSDLEQDQRETVMLDFKNSKIQILVATDIISRGIDIENIGLIINYDVPHSPEDYIHRIGRTARADAEGAAITFVCENEQGKFHLIEKFLEKSITKNPLPESVGKGPEYNPKSSDNSKFRGKPRKPYNKNRERSPKKS